MSIPKFSINHCPTNPHRWYVYFDKSKPFHFPLIRRSLEERHYQVLATTPSLYVFRSKDARLSWHSQGLIQVDLYYPSIQNHYDIEHFIKEILCTDSKALFR